MQSEQFQQFLQEQKKYENECKESVAIKQFLTILNQKKKSEN